MKSTVKFCTHVSINLNATTTVLYAAYFFTDIPQLLIIFLNLKLHNWCILMHFAHRYVQCVSEFDGLVSRIVNMTVASLDALRLDTGSWADQFHDAMNVNGGEVDEATAFDYVMHFMTFWWKVNLALNTFYICV